MTKATEAEEDLQCIQLAEIEIKQDALRDYSLHADGNCISLLGSSTELTTFELFPSPSYLVKFPYSVASWNLTQAQPLSKLTNLVDLQKIYINCDAMESQSLALEPVYVGICSMQAPAPKLVHASLSPHRLHNGQAVLAVLTSYGVFRLLTKERLSTEWQTELLDLNALFLEKIVPPFEKPPETISRFKDFQFYINRYWITAFTWQKTASNSFEHKLYAATASGQVTCMSFNVNGTELDKYQCSTTDLGRINYLNNNNELLLVSNIQGVVKVYKCNDDGGIDYAECLWSKADRMGVQHAAFTYDATSERYFVVFTKAAHILAFCLLSDGKLHSSCVHYLGGMKITGLTTLSTQQFIVTTITSSVQQITLTAHADGQLLLTKRPITSNFDTVNYQILGIAASLHKNLLTFVRFRNKELQQAHLTRFFTAITVCKLNTVDELQQLVHTPKRNMLDYMDYLTAIRLDIANELNLEKYINFQPLEQLFTESKAITDSTLQSLQIQFLLAESLQQLHLGKLNKSCVPEHCRIGIETLPLVLEIGHILLRLQHLSQNVETLSTFQKQAMTAMWRKYTTNTNKLEAMRTNLNATYQQTISRFLATTAETLAQMQLPAALAPKALEASPLHYCTLSFVELKPDLNQRYCAQCGQHALPDADLLLELYAAHETPLRCTYCRAHFIYENVLGDTVMDT